mmetsp:Transcript_3379/g.5679  ORF Transcript_3379/g.5679 Transcript_3379/m.5679 type:complete len:240 (+) Transcript_3379:869-1588(+)
MIGHVPLDPLRIELEEDAVEGPILGDGEASEQDFVVHVVEADVLGVASSEEELAVGGDVDRVEVLVPARLLSSVPLRLESASEQVILALDDALDAAALLIPDVDLAAQGRGQDVVLVGVEDRLEDLVAVLEVVDVPVLAEHVPHLHLLVPRAAGQLAVELAKADGGDGGLVAAEDVNKHSRFEAPHVDLVGLVRASAHDVALGFDAETGELSGLGGLQGPKVLVLDQVKGPDGAVGRGS